MVRKSGFTIVEFLITATVSILVITGVLITILRSMVLDEYNQRFSIAMNIGRALIEDVFSRRGDFDYIISDPASAQNCIPLSLHTDGITGCYRIEVRNAVDDPPTLITSIDSENNDTTLKNIRIVVCWMGRGGRIFGDCDPNYCEAYDPADTSCEALVPGINPGDLTNPCDGCTRFNGTSAPVDITSALADL